MTASNFSKGIILAVAAATMATQAAAMQSVPKRVVVVSLQDRKLALVDNGIVRKIYHVAVGKPSTPSPEGSFFIARRVVNPTYYHGSKTVPPGPGNPVGTRWMGLSKQGYGIHGTNEPSSIGKAASHGCIRMAKADLEEFYELVAQGDTVQIVGQRTDDTAQLFGDGPLPSGVVTQQPAQFALLDGTVLPQVHESKEAPHVDSTSTPAIASAGSR